MCWQKPAIQSGSAHTPARTGGSAATLSVVTSSTLGHGAVVAPVEAQLALREAPCAGLAHEIILVAHRHDEQAGDAVAVVDVMGQTHRLPAGPIAVDLDHLAA